MKKKKIFTIISSIIFLIFITPIISSLIVKEKPIPYSTAIFDNHNILCGARVASDNQWRLPSEDTISKKFQTALLTFEDKNFFLHPGIDPLAMLRAIYLNIKNGEVISGGSTITMQVARLLYGKNKKRSFFQKIYECFITLGLELKYSKKEILQLYIQNAPFGGNIVGLETASWKYFGVSSNNLTWAESACLAILPNCPGLIHPGRNSDILIKKRDNLLLKLLKSKVIDSTTYNLSLLENIPEKPKQMPQSTYHLTEKAKKEGKIKVKSTINIFLQKGVSSILNAKIKKLQENEIHNACAIVADSKTGEILAYVGNVKQNAENNNASKVDIIQAQRSSGSILKPFLYAGLLTEQKLLPQTKLFDIPININGFNPKNFDKKYRGVVAADKALQKSLNIPFVNMLEDYGLNKFYNKLNKLRINSINRFPADHYGLSLILGGSEVNLYEITNAYLLLIQQLNQSNKEIFDYRQLHYVKQNKSKKHNKVFTDGSVYLTFQALTELNRPYEEGDWKSFNSNSNISWKTGTSFGLRDAWAIGFTQDYIVGVWVGNADGEGRPGLTGVSAAAPVLFDIFKLLPQSDNFDAPDDLYSITICHESGKRPSKYCKKIDTVISPFYSGKLKNCTYHKKIGNDTLYILPPVPAYYTNSVIVNNSIEFILPSRNQIIYLPKNINNKRNFYICKVASSEKKLFWQLNHEYIGVTENVHEKIITKLIQGKNIITVTDINGNSKTRQLRAEYKE
ncbi:MAG: penicillin-binding protein 1C [Bacteroidales bacterium]